MKTPLLFLLAGIFPLALALHAQEPADDGAQAAELLEEDAALEAAVEVPAPEAAAEMPADNTELATFVRGVVKDMGRLPPAYGGRGEGAFHDSMGIVQIAKNFLRVKDPAAADQTPGWKYIVMMCVGLFLMYLAIHKKVEPLLLLPLSFGILIANLPMAGLSAYDDGCLMNIIYTGIRRVLYPPLIFLCLGAMTDFAPLIANPRIAIIGIGGQLGIFVALVLSYYASRWIGVDIIDPFTWKQAASTGIIGSSDGPTSVLTASILAPEMLAAIAIAAFSYMALVPFIQAPLMRLMTTNKERVIVMPHPKEVTRRQKILFPIGLTIVTLLLVPAASPLISMLMLGNIIRESGVVERYVKALTHDLLSILTMLVALSIGSSAKAEYFLTPTTLLIITCGLLAFIFGTIGGLASAKILCVATGGKINPLIGNSGVSAMPMAARISQKLGQQYNPQNFLLMHAMGPIVASTIGSAVVAGILLTLFNK